MSCKSAQDGVILAFDTSAAHCAGALWRGAGLIGQSYAPMVRGQAEALFPQIEAMLARAGVGYKDIAAIGVGVGPGNFTGIRIAVAAARGLALGLGVPAIGVSGFEATRLTHPNAAIIAPAPGGQAYLCARAETPPQRIEASAAPKGAIALLPPAALVANMARIAARRFDQIQVHQTYGAQPASSVPPPAPLYLQPAKAAASPREGPTLLP